VAFGPFEVISLILSAFRPFFFANNPSPVQAADWALFAALYAVPLLYPAITAHKFAWWWRLCLRLIVIAQAVIAIECGLNSATNLGLLGDGDRHYLWAIMGSFYLLGLLAMTIAVFADWLSRQRRDWMHFVGICGAAMQLTAVVSDWWTLIEQWWQDLYSVLRWFLMR
jgi:hypothetical protein